MISIQERLALLSEPIEGAMWQWLCMLRSSTPGKVVSFDPVTQTCLVQPTIQEIMLQPPPVSTQNPKPGVTQNIPTPVTIKPIQDVPICIPRVLGWSMTFPITAGTECLLVFSDSCIDGWWQNGGIQPPYDRRRHDLSDAIALFGPWSQPNRLSNYSTTSVQIRSDDQSTLIDISSGTITISTTSKVIVQANEVDIKSAGGTPIALVNDNFYQWFNTTFIPFLQSHFTGVPTPPSNSETTVLKGQ